MLCSALQADYMGGPIQQQQLFLCDTSQTWCNHLKHIHAKAPTVISLLYNFQISCLAVKLAVFYETI